MIKTLVKTTSVKKKFMKPFAKPSGSGGSRSFSKPKEIKGTMQSFNAVNNKIIKLDCKLCSTEGHSLGKCPSFVNYNDRLARLKELCALGVQEQIIMKKIAMENKTNYVLSVEIARKENI